MANRYQSDDRARQMRSQRGYDRQAEQFQSDPDEPRAPRQMGEGWRDVDFDSQHSGWETDDRFDREHGSEPGLRSSPAARYRTERFGTGDYGPDRYAPGGGRSYSSFTGSDFGGADFSRGTGAYRGERTYGRDTYAPGARSAGTYGAGSWLGANHGEWHDRDYYRDRDRHDERGFLERAGDAVSRWFGDEDDDGRRRESYRGHGPANYTRTDERIREDACERLTEDWRVDARKIEVTVSNAEITLDGTVASRDQKRRAEDLVDDLSGVRHVQNNLRVDEASAWDRNNAGEITGSGANKTATSR